MGVDPFANRLGAAVERVVDSGFFVEEKPNIQPIKSRNLGCHCQIKKGTFGKNPRPQSFRFRKNDVSFQNKKMKQKIKNKKKKRQKEFAAESFCIVVLFALKRALFHHGVCHF
jgi:hypothetical protein